jgi:isopentenyl diphosphate isomerase/L-lactate dehydrogenase-like FMN-dependent dehydrogenase
VEKYLQQIRSGLQAAMVLTGTADVFHVSPEILRPMS